VSILIFAAVFAMMLATLAFADATRLNLKVGQEMYACNCGGGCPCHTMAAREGNCTCRNKMVKGKVTKVEGDIAYLQAPGQESPRAFNMMGKYACDCGPLCNCNTISQNPGKCAYDKDMKKVQ
jgi:hypothetical protein